MLRKEFLEQIDIVNKRLFNLTHSFQTSAKGTQACINADNAVTGIVAYLNTVIMFATAGTLKSRRTRAPTDDKIKKEAFVFSNLLITSRRRWPNES